MQDNDHSTGKEDSEKGAKKEDGVIPSRCPFSGVSFDPSLLKEWESKMKMSASDGDEVSQLHGIHQHMMKQSKHKMKEEDPGGNLVDNNTGVLGQKKSTTQRIQITNSQSKRTKDLLVKASSSQTMWDSIYNNPSVKEANIRKWNAETVQGVKDGSKEIRLEVCIGSSSDAPSKVYTLAELKELNTEVFFEQSMPALADSEIMDSQADLVLRLQLLCVDL
mmetsp:Transcript_10030/g.23902  ORF Transcript_10030/g.23902 Transcript_10030/m.23902 type:complete len:220 (-) Transcript_10030:2009-2668(-)